MSKKIKAYGVCVYKIEQHTIKVLMCKSRQSKSKWGFLKGVAEDFETKEETALREFFEESSIETEKKYFEKYFEQKNPKKDIGIFLVNFNNISFARVLFSKDKLHTRYLSPENTNVEFFDIKKLPPIKTKQTKLTKEVVDYLIKTHS